MPAAETHLERFDRLAERFGEHLAAIRRLEPAAFVRDDWSRRNAELARDLGGRLPRDFLRHPAIRFQMFVGDRFVEHELDYVTARLSSPELLAEDAVGLPFRRRLNGIATSSNTVHQLHHLLRWEDATDHAVADLETVIEWGAGYGSLAKLLLRLHGGAPTVVLIDTPVFSALQWLYLASVLGEERVVLHRAPRAPIPDRVNIVPVGLAAELDVQADLFVSMWALNESAPAAQRLVLDRRFFGADTVLLGLHHGDPLEPELLRRGMTAEPIGDFMPGQRYFTRTGLPAGRRR